MAYPPAGFSRPNFRRMLVNGQWVEVPDDIPPPPDPPSSLPPWLQPYFEQLLDLFTADPKLTQTIDALQAQQTTTGDPFVDAIGSVQRAPLTFALDQLRDVSSPGGAALNAIPGEQVAGPALGIAIPLLAKKGRKWIDYGKKLGTRMLTLKDLTREANLNDAGAIVPVGQLASVLQNRALGPDLKQFYDLTPETIDRMRGMWQLGTQARKRGGRIADWRGIDAPELLAAFGGNQEAAETWARMWGALSPRTDVPNNTRQSIAAFLHHLENPSTPFTLDDEKKLFAAGYSIGLPETKINNLMNAIYDLKLSGEKVGRMSDFMLGQHERLPIDVHALYSLGYRGDKFNAETASLGKFFRTIEGPTAIRKGKEKLEADIYGRMEQAIVDALKQINPGVDVRTTFGEMWEGARMHKAKHGVANLKFQGGVIDILRAKGLLEPGAMMDPEKLRKALFTAGWSAASIAALFSMLQQHAPQAFQQPGTASRAPTVF